MDWKTSTVTLTHPVPLDAAGATTLSKITFREPDVDALEAIEELGLKAGVRPTVKQLRGMIVALGDASDEIVGKLHRDDLGALGEAVIPLLGGEEEETAKA